MIHTHTSIHIHTCTYIHTYIRMMHMIRMIIVMHCETQRENIPTHIHLHAHTYLHKPTYTHIYTHALTEAYRHTRSLEGHECKARGRILQRANCQKQTDKLTSLGCFQHVLNLNNALARIEKSQNLSLKIYL